MPSRLWAQRRPLLLWRPERPWLAISSAVHGGGIGLRDWVLNATVWRDYDHDDPRLHVSELADELGLAGQGIGLLTAVDVREEATAVDSGVTVTATTGVTHPIWAADTDATGQAAAAGTINVVCTLPGRMTEGALVNAVATVAEAKAQALHEAGVPGTGTVTDATAVLCPAGGEPEPYGGPRSALGAPLARAVHAAILRRLVPKAR